MGRERRPEAEGVYHVMARSIAEERIFAFDDEFNDLATLIGKAGITWYAFCGMPTHYHLLGRVPEGALAPTLYGINRSIRRGRVFDAPYKAIPVTTEGYLKWLVHYIAQNPTRPREWRWSSFVRRFPFVDDRFLVDVFGSRDRLLTYAFEAR
jgi:hypothetical protein